MPKKPSTEQEQPKLGGPSTAKPSSEPQTKQESSQEADLAQYLNKEASNGFLPEWNQKTQQFELDRGLNQHLEQLLGELQLNKT